MTTKQERWKLSEIQDSLHQGVIDRIKLMAPPNASLREEMISWKGSPSGLLKISDTYTAITEAT
ncbi:hypothetical protein J1N35_030397 [Gossypium stocksii]|uniref:Uncharacterized protein n=1 Tax=Gossypium stocksii TaxID=47602 RepID=A0A9D3ZUC8_9ROSI|nr:hypothetical protein J1N35_030397 [Gossypium stocksii]